MNTMPVDIFEAWQFAIPAGIVVWSIYLLLITKPRRVANRRARRAARRAN